MREVLLAAALSTLSPTPTAPETVYPAHVVPCKAPRYDQVLLVTREDAGEFDHIHCRYLRRGEADA